MSENEKTSEKQRRSEERSDDKEGLNVSRYVLVLYHGLSGDLDIIDTRLVMSLRHDVEDLIKEPPQQVEIDLWLESPGGDAHSAYKLAVLLRAHSCRLRVVVPDFAKSAATLLALAADEIYMAPAAELGPLDAQIPNEGELIATFSALDVARSLDDLANSALDLALVGGAGVLRSTRLSRAETLSTMLTFAARFMEPITRQLDPRMIHWSNTLLNVSVEYAIRLLKMRNSQGSTASRIAKELVQKYPTHGFVISRSEAQALGLPVFDIDRYDMAKEARGLHRSFENGGADDIGLYRLEDLLEDLRSEPDGDAE